MPSLGPLEILVVFVVALVVFGPQKLPELGRQIGRALREFQKVQDNFQAEVRSAFDTNDPPRAPSPSTPEAPLPAAPLPAAPVPATDAVLPPGEPEPVLGSFDRELPPPVAREEQGSEHPTAPPAEPPAGGPEPA